MAVLFCTVAVTNIFSQTTLYFDNCNSMAGWTNTGRLYPANIAGYNWISVDPIVPADDHTIGGNCFYVNGNNNYLEANAGNYILYQIVSNPIDLSGYTNCRLEFWMQMRSETGNWDGGFLDWSHDGVTWTQVTNAQLCSAGGMYYDGNMSQNGSSTPFFFMTKPAWFNPRTVWTRMLVDISAMDNVPAFRLRYTFHSDEAVADRGWAIDDIKIVSVAIPQVQGNSVVIADNDITPAVIDFTDFGNVVVGQSLTHTFYIHNIGESPLTLTGAPYVTATGAGFTVVSQPPTNVIPPGGSVPFDVQFSPTALGVVNGTINIPNSDTYSSCNPPNPYNFSIKGNGMNSRPYIIEVLGDTFVCPNTAPVNINITVGDHEQAAGVLTLSGTSSNPAVITNAGIGFGGAGANRIITLTPVAGAIGSSLISITVNDGQVSNFDSTFTFTLTLGDTINPIAICQNIQVQLDSTGNGSITAAQVNNGSTDNCGISSYSVSQTTFTCADVGIVPVDFTVTDIAGNTAVCNLNVTVLPPPLLLQHTQSNYNGYGVTCFGANDGSITLIPDGGCGPYTYSWQHDAANATNQATGLSAGNYTGTVTDVTGQQQQAVIQLTEPPQLVGTSVSVDISCYGQVDGSVSLSAQGGVPPYTYSQGPIITGLPQGNHVYIITDQNGCTVTETLQVIEPAGMTITGDTAFRVFCGEDVPLDITVSGGSGGYTYVWDNELALDCFNCEDPLASPNKSTVFTVAVTDNRGCTQFFSSFVEVDCNLFIPSAFSPNNDGLNDEFFVTVTSSRSFELRIYDRWGEEIFFTADPAVGWDGRHNHNKVPMGIYVYDIYVVMPNGKDISLRGMISLLR